MMSRLRTITCAIAVGLPLGAAAAQDAAPIDLERAAAIFAEARALGDADGGALWGKPLYGPTLLVEPRSRMIVTNRRDKQKRLTRAERPGGAPDDRRNDLWVGTLPVDVPVANTTMKWSGLDWTMIIWPLPGDDVTRGALLMHESFHRVQPRLGLPLSVPANDHLDERDARIWIRLEWRALAAALDDPEPLASTGLRDALIFRAYRRSLFEGAARQERELELNEGLAEYTGIKLSGADDEEQRRRALMQLRMYDRITPLVSSFAYASGPAYGRLLDEAKPGWPRRMRKKTDYGTMLRKAIGYDLPRDLETEALERARAYAFETLLAEEGERADVRQQMLDEFHLRFDEGPVLVIDLEASSRYSFNPHDVHAFEGIGTVYGTLRLSSSFGILDVTSGGALMREDRRGFRHVYVPAPADPDARPLAGDGWTLQLAPGWTLGRGPRPLDYTLVRHR
jgi:hypothetical protein